jgi:uncharacterized membrane protein (DUF485 family)
MAEQHAPHAPRGDMDIQAHQASFHAFILMSKWGSLAVAVTVLFLVLWFCTAAGFGAAFLCAAIVAVLGFLALREKPAPAH